MYGFYKDLAPWMIPKEKASRSKARDLLRSWREIQESCEDKIGGYCSHEMSCDVDNRCCLYHCPFAQPKK